MNPPPLTAPRILEMIRENREELENLGVREIALFGSFARGDADESSDIDLLVDLVDSKFDRYMDVKEFLSELFDREIDLVMFDAIKPRLRDVILAEAIRAA